MPDQPLPSDLQTVMLEALRAYELARATRLRAEGEARAARQAREGALQAEEAHARQALEAERRAEESVLRAEQERLGRLQAATDAVEAATRALLEKAGLAYIAGAPATPTGRPSAPRRADADAAQAFAEAQTAYADLRVALVTLAQAHLEAGRWEEARRVLQPLLEDTRAPLYAEARDLLAESYYRPALAAIQAQQWGQASEALHALRQINPQYRDANEWPRRHLQLAWLVNKVGEVATIRGHGYSVTSVAFSPDGRLLASGSTDTTVKIWEVASARLLHTLKVNPAYRDAATLEREAYLRPARAALEAGRYDEARPPLEAWLKAHEDDAAARDLLAESHYRPALAAIQAQQWGQASEALHALRQINPQYRDANEWPRRHLQLAWLVNKVGEVATISGHDDSVRSVAFSPDGRLLVSEAADRTIVWDVVSGKPVKLSPAQVTAVRSDTTPDGRLKANISGTRIAIVDVPSVRLLHTLSGHRDSVYSVAFSPDGRLLASGSLDKTVKIWEVASGRLLHTLSGHSYSVYSVAFSPDGRLLASGSGDNTVKIWGPA
jgi:predicted negative regulator of RcsB-dependent stress response